MTAPVETPPPRRKRGTQKGATFSEEHRAALSKAHKNSPAGRRHRRRLAMAQEGVSPSPLAIASSMATRKLQSMGLTRKGSPELHAHYTDFYRRQRAAAEK